MTKTKPYKLLEALIFAAAACAAFALFMPRGGILISFDSLSYLHAAETLAHSGTVEFFGYSTPMIQWPPLMPAVLAAVNALTHNTLAAMAVINAALLGVTVLFAGLLAGEFIENRPLRLCAIAVAAFSAWLFRIYYYLWSEGLFLALSLALFYVIVRFLKLGGRHRLAIAGVLAAGAMFTRYTGIELAGLCGLSLFLTAKPWKRRFCDAVIFGAPAGLPFLALLIRTFAVSGSFTGRAPLKSALLPHLKTTADTVAKWFYPDAGTLAAVVIIAALAIASAVMLARSVPKAKQIDRAALPAHALLAAHVVCYPVSVIYSNTRFALDSGNYRILAPVFAAAVLLLFRLAELSLPAKRGRTAAIAAAIAAALLVTAANVYSTAETAPKMRSGFTRENLAGDSLIEYAQTLAGESVKIYTNRLPELYYMTGMDVNYPPRREGVRLYLWDECMERLEESGKELYVFWYDTETNPVFYTPDEMGERLNLETVYSDATGTVYRATP